MLHSVLCTVFCAWYLMNFVFCTATATAFFFVYCVVCTLYCKLCILLIILSMAYCVLFMMQFVLFTGYCSQCIVTVYYDCILFTVTVYIILFHVQCAVVQ